MSALRLPQIFVSSRQRKVAVDRAALEAFAVRALPLCARERGAGLTKLTEISVVLVSDRKISDLHLRFLRIAGPTDVITFQHGEILISAETAQRQGQSFRTSLEQELRLYLVHGLLHLQGFDDDAPAPRLEMDSIQKKIVNLASR